MCPVPAQRTMKTIKANTYPLQRCKVKTMGYKEKRRRKQEYFNVCAAMCQGRRLQQHTNTGLRSVCHINMKNVTQA